MADFAKDLYELQRQYREIFLAKAKEIKDNIDLLKPEGYDGEIFDNNSDDKNILWQKKALEYFETCVNCEISALADKTKQERKNYSCVGCGACCRFACSEFSKEELSQKAKSGDVFATQFLQTFVPFSSTEEAKKVFPEYVNLLENNENSGYYFYHCPKVTSGNRCPDYENRPQICRDFPDNPIAFLPKTCGYVGWKSTVQRNMLEANALAEIMHFYKDKLKETV